MCSILAPFTNCIYRKRNREIQSLLSQYFTIVQHESFNKDNFDTIFTAPTHLKKFITFCTARRSLPYILLYMEIALLITEKDPESKFNHAMRIYNTYLHPSANNHVPIASSEVAAVKNSLIEGNIPIGAYITIQGVTYDYLHLFFPAFKSSLGIDSV